MTRNLREVQCGKVKRKSFSKIKEAIAEPRPTVKEHAPKIIAMEVPKESIGGIIGTGGKVIQRIQAETGTTVTIEEEGNVGKVQILGTSPKGMST